jgi:hypothetical protein
MADEPEALRRVEERLGRAAEAAERLVAQAEQARRPPPSGWQAPAGQGDSDHPVPELEALISAIASLRELIPPDAAERLLAALREVLLALRALLDHYLERLERRPPEPPEVQDIPIE